MSKGVQVPILVVCRNSECRKCDLAQTVYREVQGSFAEIDLTAREIARVGFCMEPDRCESCGQELELVPEHNGEERGEA